MKRKNKDGTVKVYDISDPKIIGELVQLGDEVSEVLWLETKRCQYITNDYLRNAETNEPIPVVDSGHM